MLSVVTGLVAGLGMLALYKGMMTSRVRKVIDTEIGHLQMHHPEFRKDYHPRYVIADLSVLDTLRLMPAVKVAAPRTVIQAMLSTATGSAGVQVNGVVPGLEDSVSMLNSKIQEGKGFTNEKKNQVLIGRKLASKMKLRLGSKLVITFSDSADNLTAAAFRVTGIYQSGNTPLDEMNIYVNILALNQLLGTGEAFHEVAVLLQTDDSLDVVKTRLSALFPGLQVESWRDISPETELLVRTVNEYSYIIMIIILVALAFGILNTMLMSVLERTREMGMMMALGTSRLRLFYLVLTETAFLTLAGTPVGVLVAYLVTGYYNRNGIDFSAMGEDMMASFGFPTMVYPVFPADKLLLTMLMVVVTSFVSCIFPAIKALSLQPVEALRR